MPHVRKLFYFKLLKCWLVKAAPSPPFFRVGARLMSSSCASVSSCRVVSSAVSMPCRAVFINVFQLMHQHDWHLANGAKNTESNVNRNSFLCPARFSTMPSRLGSVIERHGLGGDASLTRAEREGVEISIKYSGFIARQVCVDNIEIESRMLAFYGALLWCSPVLS